MVRNNTNATKNSSLGECIKLNADGNKIEEIIVDCMEVKRFEDIYHRLEEMHEFEKEHNVCCTLNSIKITSIDSLKI